jgi:hypothetical protein
MFDLLRMKNTQRPSGAAASVETGEPRLSRKGWPFGPKEPKLTKGYYQYATKTACIKSSYVDVELPKPKQSPG